jgi:membrane associated rhomboid family serine protease
VLWLIGINVAVQLVRQLLGEQADQEIILQFGLIPAAYTSDPNHDLFSLLVAPITYQFLHGGWMHLGINMLTLAAFGAPVERLLGVKRFVLFYLVCGVVAGFVHILVYPGSPDPVVGASGSISGVFGAVLMLMRYVGSLTSLLPVAGIWIGLNVFLWPVRWCTWSRGRVDCLGGAYRGVRLWPPGHPLLRASPIERTDLAD